MSSVIYLLKLSCHWIWHRIGWLIVNVSILQQNKVLKLDPYSRSSWWENGPGCKETLNKTAPLPIVEKVTDCWFDYQQVEIFQASLQGILAVSLTNELKNIVQIDLFHRRYLEWSQDSA